MADEAELVETEHLPAPPRARVVRLEARDGTHFRVAHFRGEDTSKGTVVLLNGRTEYIEKYFEAFNDFIARGYAVATMDWRGQGLADRALGNRFKGHVESFDLFLSDLHQAIESVIHEQCPAPYRLVCHSMGGNIGIRYVHDHPEAFDTVLFSAPMWGLRSWATSPGWMRALAKIANRLGLRDQYMLFGRNYHEDDRKFEGNVLTNDPERFARYVEQTDQERGLRLGSPTYGWVIEAIRSMDIIHAPGFAEAISLPVTICSGGRDTVVSGAAHRAVAERLPNGTLIEVADSKHEFMIELDRNRDRFFEAFDALSR